MFPKMNSHITLGEWGGPGCLRQHGDVGWQSVRETRLSEQEMVRLARDQQKQ